MAENGSSEHAGQGAEKQLCSLGTKYKPQSHIPSDLCPLATPYLLEDTAQLIHQWIYCRLGYISHNLIISSLKIVALSHMITDV